MFHFVSLCLSLSDSKFIFQTIIIYIYNKHTIPSFLFPDILKDLLWTKSPWFQCAWLHVIFIATTPTRHSSGTQLSHYKNRFYIQCPAWVDSRRNLVMDQMTSGYSYSNTNTTPNKEVPYLIKITGQDVQFPPGVLSERSAMIYEWIT